ncbi:MAG: hypothetical protein M3Z19_12475 [Chloroflexota bacterium]|nr:hypothetical protein [Chloroflexota bacterium]
MTSVPTLDERDTTATAALPSKSRAKRLVMAYALLALLAVVIGVLFGVRRHDVAPIGDGAAPTEQSVLATAPPGLPTPTPLATKAPPPTTVPPTALPPTAAPPTTVPPTTTPPIPVPPSAPVVAPSARSAPVVNQNGNGNGNGNGKGKDKGKGKGD